MRKSSVIILIVVLLLGTMTFADTGVEESIRKIEIIDQYAKEQFKDLKVPGMTMGILVDGEAFYLNYGYGELGNDEAISESTRFELASLSKSFTGLAVTKLEQDGKLSLDDTVSKYFDGFYVAKDGTKYDVTIEQLLHHTTGIPENSVSLFREDGSSEALSYIVEKVKGYELSEIPGTDFEYATVNYDILGGIIEKVSGLSYESYVETEILRPLGMDASYVGVRDGEEGVAVGHKISMFSPKVYTGPVFRENYPAGYVVSNAEDMVKYLEYQIGTEETDLDSLLEPSRTMNRKVKPDRGALYSRGWFHSRNQYDEVFHGGYNPGFMNYLSFNKIQKSGVVVLTNSNSVAVAEFAKNINEYLYSGNMDALESLNNKPGGLDGTLSMVVIVCGLLLVGILLFWGFIGFEIKTGKRAIGFQKGAIKQLMMYMGLSVPVLYGLYILPNAFNGVDWYTAIVWSSESFLAGAIAVVSIIILSYITYFLLLLFPTKNRFFKEAPQLIVMSLLSGLSNATVIFLITGALNSGDNINYHLFYFVVALYIYIGCRRALGIKLAELTQLIIKSIRETIFKRLSQTRYEAFEKIDSGQLLATLTADIGQIGGLARLAVSLITGIVTILAAFVYLSSISSVGTLGIFGVIIIVGGVYSVLTRRARGHFELSRETRNRFMSKTEGLINGFKDISLQSIKKKQYVEEVNAVNETFMEHNLSANRMYVNAFVIGESMFIFVLGCITFGFMYFFNSITGAQLTMFVVILVYMLGPLNGVLSAIPRITQIRVAADRIRKLINNLPKSDKNENIGYADDKEIKSFGVQGLEFKYEDTADKKGFKVGPIDLDVEKGEIMFIIGGNGSGKTTLIKQLTGLYQSHKGIIKINGQEVENSILGNMISAVFSDSYLFDRLYNVEMDGKTAFAKQQLERLNLDEKVYFKEENISTTSLSTGQKKRLHLLRCYLEDKPIFIFDELAADQDPQFRQYFYRTLLPQMSKEGKIVIAVTHDDHYFDVADKVIKLDMGQIDDISEEYMKIGNSVS